MVKPLNQLPISVDETISTISEEWLEFRAQSAIAKGTLTEQIASFTKTIAGAIQSRFPEMLGLPDESLSVMVASGIERSGSHTSQEIEQALGSGYAIVTMREG